MNFRIKLDYSSPENLVSAKAGDYFYRNGERYFLYTTGGISSVGLNKKSFVLTNAKYKNIRWAKTAKESDITFARATETWIKTGSGVNKNGWRFAGNNVPFFSPSTSTPTPTPTSTPTPTPVSTSTPTPTAAATSTPTPTVAATSTPTPTAAATSTPTPTAAPSTSTPTPTVAATSTPTPTAAPSTSTPTPTAAPSTSTPTPTVAATSTPTPTAAATSTPTPTAAPSTSTPTPTVAATSTPTPTAAPSTSTPTPTASPSTSTPTPTVAETSTPTPTAAATSTPTPTVAETSTPTPTAAPSTSTPTPTVAETSTPTPTAAATSTPTPTVAETSTPTPTAAATSTPTPTPTVVVNASGYVYYLPDCSQDTIEACYYSGTISGNFVKNIEEGDTIVLPSGSATWGNGSRFNSGRIWFNTPGITIRGQGDDTVITLDDSGAIYTNGVINLIQPNIVFGWMKIKGAGDRPVTAFRVAANNCRITNITYEGQPDAVPNNGQSGAAYFVYTQDISNTLIDHCIISASLGNHEWLFTRGPTNAWQSDPVIGTTNQDIFVEDCYFYNSGYSDANSNARQVFRFNTINGSIKFDSHGMASNTPARSARSVEYYNNNWISTGNTGAAIEIRGGSGMVFNNSGSSGLIYLTDYIATAVWPNSATVRYQQGDIVATPSGSYTVITTPVTHSFVTGMSIYHAPFGGGGIEVPAGYYTIRVLDSSSYDILNTAQNVELLSYLAYLKTPYDWPLFDQVGNGKDGADREPMYLWGNTKNGTAWGRTLKSIPSQGITTYRAQTGNESATYTEADIIAPNRDFFASDGFDSLTGCSVGTRAQMDAYTPSVVGYGWWVTDEGSWNLKLQANTSGRLYKWNGSSWVLFYTPYTYPHPLQTATEAGTPEVSIGGGVYEYTQSVYISVIPPDASCRYTLEGTNPTSTVGTLYTGEPINIDGTATLKAIAYKTGLNDSPIKSVYYEITNRVFKPTSNLSTGEYRNTQSVTLACATTGATIYYTTDGTIPTTSSTVYTGAISVTSTTTIRAMGYKSDLLSSEVLTITITILNEVGWWDSSVGGMQGYYTGERRGLAPFTANITGELSKISVYGTNPSASLDIEFGLYEQPYTYIGSTLLKVEGTPQQFTDVGTWTNEWKEFDVSFPVTASKKYWIMLGVSNDIQIKASYPGGVGNRINYFASYGTGWGNLSYHNQGDGWKFNVKGLLTDPNLPTPTPTFTPEPTSTPTPTPTPRPTITPAPTYTPTGTPTPTATIAPTNTPTETPTSAPTNVPTETPTSTPTNAPTQTPTPTPTVPISYLINEDFENATQPNWTRTHPAMQTSSLNPLFGTKSLRVISSNAQAYAEFAPQDEVWAFTSFRLQAGSLAVRFISIRDSSGTILASIGPHITSTRFTGPGKDVFIADILPRDQTAFVWIHYVKGTGANSIAEFYVSTTATRPASPNYSWSNGSSTAQASRLYFNGEGGAPDIRWDYTRVSASEIGNNPDPIPSPAPTSTPTPTPSTTPTPTPSVSPTSTPTLTPTPTPTQIGQGVVFVTYE